MDINSAGFYESLQTQRDDGSSKKNVFDNKKCCNNINRFSKLNVAVQYYVFLFWMKLLFLGKTFWQIFLSTIAYALTLYVIGMLTFVDPKQ